MTTSTLITEIRKIKKSKTGDRIAKRLQEFRKMGSKSNEDWFCEICFCILTANSKAKTALAIQDELGIEGFHRATERRVCDTMKRNKHRFHNTKAKYIVGARKFLSIKDLIKNEKDPRAWLVANLKGLGWKESSHFLRNVGYTDYAIIDRHVISLMHTHGLISSRPKSLDKQTYLSMEQKLVPLCKSLSMSQAELDMYLWYMKTSEVLK